MFLAKITKKIIATEKHPAYNGKTVYVVQPVHPDGREAGSEWVAMDYVGSSVGDTVICGGAPGVAATVFNIKLAPIRTLIVAIVDSIDYRDMGAA